MPWQEYVKPYSTVGQPPKDITDKIRIYPPTTNRIWWNVAACVVFVLLAGGIGLYFYCNGKEQEKIEAARRNIEEISERTIASGSRAKSKGG